MSFSASPPSTAPLKPLQPLKLLKQPKGCCTPPIKLRHVPNRRFFNDLCDILGIANSIVHYLSAPPFAPLRSGEIDGVDMRALVDVDTGIIENYWGCILRQLASIKVSVQINFYLTKIRAEPYKNN